MSKLIAPSELYPQIQDAINAANPGDSVLILPGNYTESLYIINKDNISLLAANNDGEPLDNFQVKFVGIGVGDTGLTIEANNTTVSGIRFGKFDTAVSLNGNNNVLTAISCLAGGRGFSISGNNNKFITCIAEQNTIVGINVIGNYNQFIACRFDYNKRGVVALSGNFTGNVFYKNYFNNNSETNLRISNPNADMNVFRENTISNSTYGLLCNSGRVAIISNIFLNHSDVAVVFKDNKGIIIDNNLGENSTGLYLNTCGSLIAGNIVQKGDISGIVITGRNNSIISNMADLYNASGMVINGCENNLCGNTLIDNRINLICNEKKNNVNDCCDYCAGLGCTNFNDVSKNLEIFKIPIECFYK